MRNDRRRTAWADTRPTADPALRASAFRVSARIPRMWGFVLARLRAARGLSPTAQAAELGITESALAFLCISRLPRPGRTDGDLASVSDVIGVSAAILREMLRAADEVR